MPLQVQRVVSLAPNLTETVYALGLEDKLVGDTIYCDTPAAATRKPHIGAPLTPSLEAIVALHPDLVLATAINRWETVEAITKLGIPVYTVEQRTVRDMLSVMNSCGMYNYAGQWSFEVGMPAKSGVSGCGPTPGYRASGSVRTARLALPSHSISPIPA